MTVVEGPVLDLCMNDPRVVHAAVAAAADLSDFEGTLGDLLADSQDYALGMAFLGNPTAPDHLLRAYAARAHPAMLAVVARNPACPLDLLDAWLTGLHMELAAAAALNPAIPPEHLDRLASHRSERLVASVARNPSTPRDTLLRLEARDPIGSVGFAAAVHASGSNRGPALAALADEYTLRSIATHPAAGDPAWCAVVARCSRMTMMDMVGNRNLGLTALTALASRFVQLPPDTPPLLSHNVGASTLAVFGPAVDELSVRFAKALTTSLASRLRDPLLAALVTQSLLAQVSPQDIDALATAWHQLGPSGQLVAGELLSRPGFHDLDEVFAGAQGAVMTTARVHRSRPARTMPPAHFHP